MRDSKAVYPDRRWAGDKLFVVKQEEIVIRKYFMRKKSIFSKGKKKQLKMFKWENKDKMTIIKLRLLE